MASEAGPARERRADGALRQRAAAVIPGGMYGHLDANRMPDAYPQFFARGKGGRVWDVDGNEYIDLMCSWGPVVLGHQHPVVDEAVLRQLRDGDCLQGPSPSMVELAELMVERVAHADWAMFCKNGTDATTLAVTIARAATGRRKLLIARGAYHGAAPWCTPVLAGVTPEDRSNTLTFEWNDLPSVEAAVTNAAGDVAAIMVCPFRHDLRHDQELADPEFARGLRRICDRIGAALILDDVRCGLRLDTRGSWEPLGVRPDLSAWSKAIANGHAIAAVLGADALRDAASSVFATGSFWFSAVPMAAAIATINEMQRSDGIATMVRAGTRLRQGLAEQALAHGVGVALTGPVQMPYLSFANDADLATIRRWVAECVSRGLYLHPIHNWFLSAAHTDADIDRALEITDLAFAAVSHPVAV